MNGNSEELTSRQERAVAALVTSRSVAAAARKAEVGESTLRRWMKKPVFQSGLRQARRVSFSRAVGALHQVAENAVAVLDSVMRDPTASHASRVRAAQTALRYSSPPWETRGSKNSGRTGSGERSRSQAATGDE